MVVTTFRNHSTRIRDGFVVLLTVLVAVCGVPGCSTIRRGPNLKQIYEARARHHGPERRPVIVIPGILGSRLEEAGTGTVVWGAFDGKYAHPNRPDGARLTALPMQLGRPLKTLRDDVVPISVLRTLDVNLLFVPIRAQAYAGIMQALGVGGFQDTSISGIDYGEDHFTCFQFPYDWRRDNAENAARLHEFILEKQRFVRGEIERRYGVSDADVKFDLVAHSMGGLLTRYYLRYGAQPLPDDGSLPELTWEGAQHVDRVIIVGTPNSGSIQAVKSMLEGDKEALILPRYPAAVLGTMPAAYQLMPRSSEQTVVVGTGDQTDPVDLYDPAVWEQMEWGLADPRQEKILKWLLPDVADPDNRRAIALDHLRKCLKKAKQFQDALDVPAAPPATVHLQLLAGDAIETPSVVRFDPRRRKLKVLRKSAGDGLVTRKSALMDQRTPEQRHEELQSPIRWERVTFIFDDHLGMTGNPQFVDNVLYSLLEEPRTQQPLPSGPDGVREAADLETPPKP